MARIPVGDLLARLESLKATSGTAARRSKLALLGKLYLAEFPGASSLLRYRDCLLFLMAWPDDGEVRAAADDALDSIPGRVAALLSRGRPSDLRRLHGSGLPGTPVTRVFPWPAVRWLTERFPGQVSLDRSDRAALDRFRVHLACLLTRAEAEPLRDESLGVLDWAEAAGGDRPGGKLRVLVELLQRSGLGEREMACVYDTARLPVTCWLDESTGLQAGAVLTGVPVHFQTRPLRRRVPDPVRAIRRPIPAPRRADRAAAEGLLELARRAALTWGESPAAIFHADPGDLYLRDAGRGVLVACAGLRPRARKALRTTSAFLVLKNGMPVVCGTADAIFGEVELHAFVPAALRDGDITELLQAVLGLQARLTGGTRFHVRPRRVGGRLCPLRPAWEKLGFRRPGGGASRGTARLVLDLDEPAPPDWKPFRVERVSLAITRFVSTQFGGNRSAAGKTALRILDRSLELGERGAWSADELFWLRELGLVISMIPALDRWPAADRRRLARALRAKGSVSEFRFAFLLSKHRRLEESLRRIAEDSARP